MSSITPSQALLLPEGTPISECVRRMRENNIGSILVTLDAGRSPSHLYRKGAPAELVGIFTERDLVVSLQEIQKGGYWERPVSAVMTRNPFKLPVARIDEAASLMLKRGFRHVPIVADHDGREVIVGVVSMRDLFRQMIEGRVGSEIPVKPHDRPVVGVLAGGDRPVNGPLSAISVDLRAVSMDAFAVDPLSAKDVDAILIDIDLMDPKAWPPLLRKVNQAKGLPLAIVLLDPLFHDAKAVATLDRLNDAEKFAIFHKPVNLIELARRVRIR